MADIEVNLIGSTLFEKQYVQDPDIAGTRVLRPVRAVQMCEATDLDSSMQDMRVLEEAVDSGDYVGELGAAGARMDALGLKIARVIAEPISPTKALVMVEWRWINVTVRPFPRPAPTVWTENFMVPVRRFLDASGQIIASGDAAIWDAEGKVLHHDFDCPAQRLYHRYEVGALSDWLYSLAGTFRREPGGVTKNFTAGRWMYLPPEIKRYGNGDDQVLEVVEAGEWRAVFSFGGGSVDGWKPHLLTPENTVLEIDLTSSR